MQDEFLNNIDIGIPEDIMHDKNLTGSAKLLYGLIDVLTNASNYCLMSNEKFAKAFNKTERSICRWLKELKDGGFVFSAKDYLGRRRLYTSRIAYESDKAKHFSVEEERKVDINNYLVQLLEQYKADKESSQDEIHLDRASGPNIMIRTAAYGKGVEEREVNKEEYLAKLKKLEESREKDLAEIEELRKKLNGK